MSLGVGARERKGKKRSCLTPYDPLIFMLRCDSKEADRLPEQTSRRVLCFFGHLFREASGMLRTPRMSLVRENLGPHSSLIILTVAVFAAPKVYAEPWLKVTLTVSSPSVAWSSRGVTQIDRADAPAGMVTVPGRAR